eukprot:5252332-Alexandrium_andersonii.AAC.1
MPRRRQAAPRQARPCRPPLLLLLRVGRSGGTPPGAAKLGPLRPCFKQWLPATLTIDDRGLLRISLAQRTRC